MKIFIIEPRRAKVIREGLYIPGLNSGVFRPSPHPIRIKDIKESGLVSLFARDYAAIVSLFKKA